jgi:hypothetical protein
MLVRPKSQGFDRRYLIGNTDPYIEYSFACCGLRLIRRHDEGD